MLKRLIEEVNTQQVTWEELGRRSGVSVACMKNWPLRGIGNYPNIEACFNALGMELYARYKKDDD